jgi:hypothetical protein
MTVATGTGTTAELVTLYKAAWNLTLMLEYYYNGSAAGGSATSQDGRFTKAQIDTQIAAVSAAITAVNA